MKLLSFLVILLTGCANIGVKRTYSLGYGKGSASVTLEPASKPSGKQVVPLR